MSISNQTDFYLNFQQFGELKLGARENSDEAAVAVAQQFEGLFVQQMLAAMRSASKIDGGEQSSHMDFYQDMYDKQLAQTIAKQDRLGVARMILQQIPGTEDGVDGVEAVEKAGPHSLDPTRINPASAAPALQMPTDPAPLTAMPASAAPALQMPTNAVPVTATPAAVVGQTPVEKPAVVLGKVVDDDFAEVAQIERNNNRWQTPDRFIADILPQAQTAADALGVSARLLAAQSALETGWGKHTMKLDDGRSSNNLFGIKAGSDWRGDALNRTSLEFGDGALYNQVSRFRAYASPAQSLADYVEFIQENPRYQQALKHAGDDEAYIREIQNAGYATDPHYADKVISILNGELMQQAVALTAGEIDHG
jgi:flagellar protein FlgJ